MTCRFFKLEGAGNDFVFIDDFEEKFPDNHTELIRQICERRYGIGSDGLVLLRPSSVADCRMIYFNADGKEALFCGNALRCTLLALRACGHHAPTCTVESRRGVMRCSLRGDCVQTTFPNPQIVNVHALEIDGQNLAFTLIDSGVPHAVTIVEHLDRVDVRQLGRAVRFHPDLGVQGANVTFVEPNTVLRIRTYERGIEDETLSCGSGVMAAACLMRHTTQQKEITIATRGKHCFSIDTEQWLLTGPARLIFEGHLKLASMI